MVFPSKVDTWVWLAFVISCVGVGAGLLPAFLVDDVAPVFVLATTALCLLFMGLFLWMLLGTDYTVLEVELRIRSGPFRWVVDRAHIQGLTRTRNPRSAPALSLDRIEIRYGARGRVFVSPQDAVGFASALGVPLE